MVPRYLIEQGFSPSVLMAWGPLHGECQEFDGICIQDGIITPKMDAWASAPMSHPHVVSL